jgi:serine/threonine protein kinase
MPTVITCPVCKQVLEPGVRFCPNDGTPLTETAAGATVITPTGPERIAGPELQLPVVVGGRYRLTEIRGGGGMAKVYRAVDVTLDRVVAVKLINPELRNDAEFDARFAREARIASQLTDPHIVVVHDFGIDALHGPFLVMEYLTGLSLRERLQAEGPLPYKAGLQLCAQLLLALITAHGKNIVHRDIKPDNVFLLNQSGIRLHIRVLDFGIARIYHKDDPSQSNTLTSPGAVLGTPRYMAPEQLAGQPVDARADLYSAAVVIHETLTGHLPYVSGKKLVELCPEATPALQELVDQCLKPNAAERPPTAVEVYLRLQELGKASGILLLPPGAMEKLASARHGSEQPTVAHKPAATHQPLLARRRLLIPIVGVIGLVLAAVLVKYLVFPSTARWSGPQTLHGIRIGDPDLPAELKLKPPRSADPWEKGTPPTYLAHLLHEQDLGLTPDQRKQLTVRTSADEHLAVLLSDYIVCAVVVRQPYTATTGRGLAVGSKVDALYRLYDENPTALEPVELTADEPEFARGHVEVHRYDQLGVAFMTQKDRVIAIALYPAKSNP